MENKNKKTFIIIVVIILLIIVFIWWKNKSNPDDKKEEASGSLDNEKQTITNREDVMGVFPLKLGSRNPEVKKVQSLLLKNEGAQIKIDGVWGKETDAAIKRLLKVDQISEDRYKLMGL